MKKSIILILVFFAFNVIHSQAPAKISFQAVVRTAVNVLVVNKPIGVRVSIVKVQGGAPLYVETFNPNPRTNSNGLLTLLIGGGTPVLGTFSSINWATNELSLKTEFDVNGGTNYSLVTTTQLWSVPYALSAKTVENLPSIKLDQLSDVNLGTTVTNGAVLKFNGTEWIAGTDISSGGTGDNWGTQNVIASAPISGNGLSSSPLKINDGGITSSHIKNGEIGLLDLNTQNVPPNSVMKFIQGQLGSSWTYAPSKDITAGAGLNIIANSVTDAIAIGVANNGISTELIKDGTIGLADLSTQGVPLNSVIKLVGGQLGSSWQYTPARVITAGTGISILGNSTNDDIVISSTGTVTSVGSNDPNFLTKWSSANTITKSGIFEEGGKVGIGVAPPSAKLDVNGDLKSFSNTNNKIAFTATHAGSGANKGTAIKATSENIAVHGFVTNSTVSVRSGIGVLGDTDAGTGVEGIAAQGDGMKATSLLGNGILATTSNSNNATAAVKALNSATDGFAVFGETSGANSVSLFGNNTNGTSVYGKATTGEGIFGDNGDSNTSGFAGFFRGRVQMTKGLTVVGNIAKGSSTFKIDHPLDPENKYLIHSVVESPDMMNIYNGTVILDNNGEAVVELPNYFSSLNKDFRYSLTPIGSFAPVFIKEEISDNHFVIGGGKSGQKISWQITGVRNDKFAEKYRIVPEEIKDSTEKGLYLHPELYNLDSSRAIYKNVISKID